MKYKGIIFGQSTNGRLHTYRKDGDFEIHVYNEASRSDDDPLECNNIYSKEVYIGMQNGYDMCHVPFPLPKCINLEKLKTECSPPLSDSTILFIENLSKYENYRNFL